MTVTRSRFWRARFARIYPLYALAIVVSVVPYLGWGRWHAQYCVGHHAILSGNQPLVGALSSVFLLQAWLPCAMTWNAPAWSLSAELVFYLLFPLVALAMARWRRPHLCAAAVVFWAMTLAVALSYPLFSLDASALHAAWWERYWMWVLYSNPLARLPEFLFGFALGRLFLSRPRTGWRTTRRLVSPTLLSILALLGITVMWCIGPFPLILLNQVVLDPLYALLIYSLACGEGPLAAAFAVPAVALLGEASYAVYILHWPIRMWMGHFVTRLPLGTPTFLAPSTVYFLVYLCIVVVVSIISFHFVERPARNAVNRVFSYVRTTRLKAVPSETRLEAG